jgi:hypothetical protein
MKTAKTKPEPVEKTTINIRFVGGKTAQFTHSDSTHAREHFEQLRTIGVVAGEAIRSVTLD